MAIGVLYTYPDNFRAFKALIAAQYSGADVKVDEKFIFGETNKTLEFLKKFPGGKVPAFETSDHKYITESNAIAYYLANETLRGGKCPYSQAQVQQWLSFADNEIVPVSCAWVFPLLGIMPLEKKSTAKEDAMAVLQLLNDKLLECTYLVNERITLADIVVFTSLLHMYQYVLTPQVRSKFGNVTRWFTTILNQKEVQAIIKSFTLCEKELKYDPKKYSEFQAKTHGISAAVGAAAVGSGTNVSKKTGKPKDDKKKEKNVKSKAEDGKCTDDENDDDDPTKAALAFEPKAQKIEFKKSDFNLEDFKRCYSNENESVSIPYFWNKFDKENFSIWFSEYKYNEELTKVYMSCNLIGGMFQRLDKMRKFSFASVCLFGEDNNSSISGVWVWNGPDLIFTLSPDWQIDYDCYKWTKLDVNSEETKKLVSQYFSWQGTDKDGREFNQGKVFK